MKHLTVLPLVLVALLAACGKGQDASRSAPAEPAKTAAAAQIKAPAGHYKLDPNHTSLTFRLQHLGLSNYVMQFMKYDVQLTLDPARLENSSVSVTIDPTSVRTTFQGDFKATHKDSPYNSFEERIAREGNFLNSDKFPSITFKSTKVEPHGDKLHVTGDLTFLGQTHPVMLEAMVTGSFDQHPMTKTGAVAFVATTTLKRSEWGMTGTQQFLGDAVTVEFNGEFGLAETQEPAPAPAN